jgi:hypothetical protein
MRRVCHFRIAAHLAAARLTAFAEARTMLSDAAYFRIAA